MFSSRRPSPIQAKRERQLARAKHQQRLARFESPRRFDMTALAIILLAVLLATVWLAGALWLRSRLGL